MSVISIATSLYTIKKVRDTDGAVTDVSGAFCVDTLSLLFQQYVMLHDMVAAHSVLRVSVCRGNKGTFPVICILSTDKLTPVTWSTGLISVSLCSLCCS